MLEEYFQIQFVFPGGEQTKNNDLILACLHDFLWSWFPFLNMVCLPDCKQKTKKFPKCASFSLAHISGNKRVSWVAGGKEVVINTSVKWVTWRTGLRSVYSLSVVSCVTMGESFNLPHLLLMLSSVT